MDDQGKIGVIQKDLEGNGKTSPKAENDQKNDVQNDDIDLEDLDFDGLESAKSEGQDEIDV